MHPSVTRQRQRQRRRLRGEALVLCASLIATTVPGCGAPENQLEGSLSDVYSLEFETVDAQLVGTYLVVQYLRAAGGGKTLKMSIDLNGYTVSPGAPINLTDKGASGSPRGTLQRIVDAPIDLPLAAGTLTLKAVPTAGMPLGGNFGATFTMPAGRSLHGDFQVDKVGQL